MNKKMSDSEVSDMAFKKLTGDLDHIEADSVFAPEDEPSADPKDGVEIRAHGVSVKLMPMNGEQTKEMPKVVGDEDGLDKFGE